MESALSFISQHGIEIIGLVLGLFYLYFEYQARPIVWLFGLLMPLISGYVYFRAGLYADFGINIYYFLAAAYGLLFWTRGGKDKTEAPITHASASVLALCVIATAAVWYAIFFILRNYTPSTVPVLDAFTTALSIVASLMMARKYVEQWLAWIIVDIVCVYLYVYKNIPFYAVLYAVYTVVGILGYRKWLRLMRAPQGGPK